MSAREIIYIYLAIGFPVGWLVIKTSKKEVLNYPEMYHGFLLCFAFVATMVLWPLPILAFLKDLLKTRITIKFVERDEP